MKHVSVIIPALCKNPITVKSIPDYAQIIVSDWVSNNKKICGASVSRNIGVMKAKGDILVFMDDDIEFTHEFFDKIVSFVKKGVVVGLKCQWHEYLITRVLAITKEDFFESGGFNPLVQNHEDIEFSYRMESMGNKLVKFDVDSVYHIPHKKATTVGFFSYMRINVFLAFQYPRHFKKLPRCFVDYFYNKIIKPRDIGLVK